MNEAEYVLTGVYAKPFQEVSTCSLNSCLHLLGWQEARIGIVNREKCNLKTLSIAEVPGRQDL